MQVTSQIREPLITGGKTMAQVSDDICRQVEGKPTKSWITAFTIAVGVLCIGAVSVGTLLWEGVGVWNLNKTVG